MVVLHLCRDLDLVLILMRALEFYRRVVLTDNMEIGLRVIPVLILEVFQVAFRAHHFLRECHQQLDIIHHHHFKRLAQFRQQSTHADFQRAFFSFSSVSFFGLTASPIPWIRFFVPSTVPSPRSLIFPANAAMALSILSCRPIIPCAYV